MCGDENEIFMVLHHGIHRIGILVRMEIHDHIVFFGLFKNSGEGVARIGKAVAFPFGAIRHELTDQAHAGLVHAMDLLYRFLHKGGMHVKARNIGVAEDLAKLQRIVVGSFQPIPDVFILFVRLGNDRSAEL